MRPGQERARIQRYTHCLYASCIPFQRNFPFLWRPSIMNSVHGGVAVGLCSSLDICFVHCRFWLYPDYERRAIAEIEQAVGTNRERDENGENASNNINNLVDCGCVRKGKNNGSATDIFNHENILSTLYDGCAVYEAYQGSSTQRPGWSV